MDLLKRAMEEPLLPLLEPIPEKTLASLWVTVIEVLAETRWECPPDPHSIICPRADSLLWLESPLGELVFHFLKSDARRERLMRDMKCPHYESVRRIDIWRNQRRHLLPNPLPR